MRRKKKNTKIYIMLIFLFMSIGVVYGALTTGFSVSGRVNVSSATYGITYSGSNVTFSPTSGSIIYGSTTTNKITPATGYYLQSFSCTNGYTASASTGIGATATQTITINNNKKVGASTCTATMSNSYTVTMSGSNVVFSSTSFSVPYANSNTVTVTPSTGYYLSGLTCTNGYTATATTGTSAVSAQTATIKNNGVANNSTCTATTALRTFTTAMSGSNVTFSSNSLAITYGSTKTVTLTPATGYYLSGISCTNGYTVTATTGTSATAAQTITIKNNSKVANSTCTATMAARTFTATMSGSNVTFGATSVGVAYGGSKTVTLTPKSGYYLSGISCTNGYTVTATTGTSATGAQTITIKNNSKVANSTCTANIILGKIDSVIDSSGKCNANASCTTNTLSTSLTGTSCYDSDNKKWRDAVASATGPSFTMDITSAKKINYDYNLAVYGSYDATGTITLTVKCGSISASKSVIRHANTADNHSVESGTLSIDVSSLTGTQTCTSTINFTGNGSNTNYCYNNEARYTISKIYPSY